MSDENLARPMAPTIEEIREKITLLSSYNGDDLKPAMDNLKKAIMENPAAASIVSPAEIGEMVKYLMKLEGKMLIDAKVKASIKKERKEKPVQLNQAQIDAMFDKM